MAGVLHQQEVLVVFMTANVRRIPIDFADAVGVIAKPYTTSGVIAALEYLSQGVRAPPPQVAIPSGLTLSPSFEGRWRL